jgi:ubiquinone/menaquinone biosynthesis C-methylase UbiE
MGMTRDYKSHFERRSRASDDYSTSDYSSPQSFSLRAALLRDWLGHPQRLTIADIGCANGQMTAALLPSNTVVGLDFSLGMVTSARKRGLLPVQASADRLPLRSASVDLTLAIEVAPCFEELDQLLDELVRITRPGGRLMMSGAASSWLRRFRSWTKPVGPLNPHLHSAARAKAMLESRGVDLVRSCFWFQPSTLRSESRPGSLLGAAIGSAFAVLGTVR